MSEARLSEVEGKWSVVVQTPGGAQVYWCLGREHAERWLALLNGPARATRATVTPVPFKPRQAG